jgi:hypothetical protein
MARPLSKPKRWAAACRAASVLLTEIEAKLDALENSISDLNDLRQEYSDTFDNMPQNLQSSPYGEKLSEVANLQTEDAAQVIRDAVEEVSGIIYEAEGMDLPRGFGKD